MVDRVVDKERANFCELFEPSLKAGSQTPGSDRDALRQAAESLFKTGQ